MARDLKAGDRLRMLGSIALVESVDNDKSQTVYNLDVALNRDFFVGSQGLLVHDSNFVKPEAEPFDQEPDLATLSTNAAPSQMPARRETCARASLLKLSAIWASVPIDSECGFDHEAQSRWLSVRTSTPCSKRNSRQRLGRWQWSRTRSASYVRL